MLPIECLAHRHLFDHVRCIDVCTAPYNVKQQTSITTSAMMPGLHLIACSHTRPDLLLLCCQMLQPLDLAGRAKCAPYVQHSDLLGLSFECVIDKARHISTDVRTRAELPKDPHLHRCVEARQEKSGYNITNSPGTHSCTCCPA